MNPAGNLEWPGSNRFLVERHLIDVWISRQNMLWHDAERIVALAENGVDERRERLFQMKDDGVGIRRIHRADLIVSATFDHVVVGIHYGLPGKPDVVA